MVEVRPFKGLEYDPKRVELGAVVAPPFDVINEKDAEALRKKNPYNLVHLTLPKSSRKNGTAYEHASQLLEEWMTAGVLRESKDEAVYAVEIWHRLQSQERRMRGVFLALRVDPTYKQVVPHERIFEKPAEDRLNLLRATGVDLEPIWLLYSGKSVEETLWAYIDGGGAPADLLVTGPDGAHHKVWRIVDPAVVSTVVDGLKGRKTYIADGHHRYATAVKYAEERRLREYRPSKNAPYEFKMVLLTHMSDPGLAILPTHRVVKNPKKIDAKALRSRLEADFTVEDRAGHLANLPQEILAELEKEGSAGGHRFALYLGDGAKYWILGSRVPILPEEAAPGRSFTWRSLDVAFLQKLVVEKHVGVPEKKWGEDVYYTRSEKEAVDLVHAGKASCAVFHLPTKLPQLRAVADGGEVMPPKSTFFVPKTVSGLVLHKIGKPTIGEEVPKRRFTS